MFKFAVLPAALAAAFAANALAQTPKTTVAPAKAAPVVLNVEVDYAITLGMEVGEANLRINAPWPDYAATLTRKATGAARWAVGNAQDYTQTARGMISTQGVRPASYERRGGRRGRVVQVAFTGADVITIATPALGSMGNPPASLAQRLEAVDDVSAFVAMVFTPQGTDPCARTIKIYDGRQRYDLVLRPNGATQVNIRGFRGEAKRCSVTYRPVAGFTDPVEVKGGMTFVFAPLRGGVWAPVRVETRMEDGNIAVLDARRVALR
jgi:hypothetical protein